MKNIVWSVLGILLMTISSCSSSDDEIKTSIWFGCYYYDKPQSASFYLFPQGQYVSIKINSPSEYFKGSPIAIAYKSDGTSVNASYNYSVYYSSDDNVGYADYSDKIPVGNYFVFCCPVAYDSYMGINLTFSPHKLNIVTPDVSKIRYKQGMYAWEWH
ncbi:MAG TPA: hypothetical protein PK026_05220 [Bacteroides graminisolvens]|nr:hypothetical protein [Bacteroides graminisolvens]